MRSYIGIRVLWLNEVARLPIKLVARELAETVGLKRTALVGGVKETRRVQEWILGSHQPQRPEALRTALQAARIIADSEGPSVAQAWFTGCNPYFEFRAPAIVIRDGNTETFADVVRAAYEFAQR